jgi:hypothetical protein
VHTSFLVSLLVFTVVTNANAAPAPYSVPWQLRPTAALNVLRSDTAVSISTRGTTTASLLLVGYKVTPSFSPLVRLGLVHLAPRSGAPGTAFLNPVLGGTYAFTLSEAWRLAFFLGVALPIGGGGGNTPAAGVPQALAAGILTRSAMDNAMFAVNDLTVFPGVGLSYVAHGLTVQLEATVLQLTRVRGELIQPDTSRTNFTSGLHVGYFVMPQISLGAELRYQRWLSTPAAVVAAAENRDSLTFAVGVRTHWKVGDNFWLRPGIAYARGLDRPMSTQNFNIVQLDIPFLF